MTEPWLSESISVAEELGSDPVNGLTHDEAAARLARVGPNVLDPKAPVPAWRKLLQQFVDPLVFLLLGAVAISVVTWMFEGAHGVPFEALVIAVIPSPTRSSATCRRSAPKRRSPHSSGWLSLTLLSFATAFSSG